MTLKQNRVRRHDLTYSQLYGRSFWTEVEFFYLLKQEVF